MNNNILTVNLNGNCKVEKDVRFSVSLSSELNRNVEAKAKELGLTKMSYIRMILSQSVKEV